MSRRRAFEDNEITLSYHNKRPRSGLTSYDRYTVAWMCALHIEMAAARAMLDEEHDSPPKTDSNSYVLGTIHRQHVVIACLPASAYGTNNAAIVMSNLKRTFPNIDVCLMVGIGGGVPNKADIRLGDVVVGTRVMQYDLGKTINGELQRTGVYKHPGSSILTVISNLRSRHELEGSRVPTILKNKMEGHAAYGLPTEPDRLFESSYNHLCPDFSCDECDQDRLEVRKTRSSTDPAIYYGGIASSNQVMKDATCRDKIASELDVLCFEMEAAGLMDIESCLPIRGICDYSDSHKAKGWQRYAAATAASYAYELLEVKGRDTRDVQTYNPSIVVDEESTSDQRHEQILKCLDFEAIDARKTTIKAAHSKTCRWFLKHEQYLAWKDPAKVSEHHGFLWIRGKPGAGKSTIMKFIYLESRKKDKKNQILTASFFFNARGEALEKTISGMYRSLLLQLFKGFPDLQYVLDNSDLLPQSQITCPSLNSLKDLLRSAVLKLGQRTFTCFIDALDECDEQQVMDLVYFFEEVAETCTGDGIRLRICFSSRHYPYIDIDRGMRLTVEDQEGHASDLESYIESNLRIKDPALVAQLQERMLVKASGVFLWVVLVVDVLNDENRRGRLNLRKRLEQIPNGLSELFKDILRRDNTKAEELQLCLLWILLSKRPLRPDEYYHALWSGLSLEGLADDEIPSVNTTDAAQCFYKSIVSSSKGLAEITKAKQPSVQFIHESVRDFLIKDGGLTEIWPELKANWESFGHNKLKRCCDFYFRLCVTPKDGIAEDQTAELVCHDSGKNHPFLEYACRFILDHANCATDTYCQQDFMSKFPISHWIDVFNRFEKHQVRMYSPKVELFYILADRGYSSLIRTRLKADPRSNYPHIEERYVYPLIAAMAQGHKDSVVALLELPSPIHEGVDITKSIAPNVNSGGKIHTPLSWACEHGHIGIAKLLFERGASRSLKRGFTLLMYAAKSGSVELVEWLLDIGEDIRAANNMVSVISQAVESGNVKIVQILLDRGIEPDTITPKGWPILSLALRRRHEAMAMVILDKGAQVGIANRDGRLPVHFATSKAVLEALVDNEANINARDRLGYTCLWNAIMRLDLDALSFLIEHEADVRIRNNLGETCLFPAVVSGNIGAIDLLCKNGANPNARNSGGQTFLHYVASQAALPHTFYYELFQTVDKCEVNMNVHDHLGNTPLHIAAKESREMVLDFWLRHGADINPRNNQGKTPLDVAISWGNKSGTHWLVNRGAKSGYEIAKRAKQVAEPSHEDHGGESRGYLVL